jgi:alkylated DNA repair dioxygenase AlkB
MHVTAAEQQALFDGVQGGPPGLRYEGGFIGIAEERDLLAAVGSLPFHEAEYRGYSAKRRIVSYGAGYDFDANVLRPAPPVPAFLHPLRARVAQRLGVQGEELTHALVTEYRPGTQLGWHRDVPDFEVVAGASLAGWARMRFRPYPPVRGRARATFAIDLQPRSAYIIRDAARWQWQHAISPTRELRYSITFRTVRSR